MMPYFSIIIPDYFRSVTSLRRFQCIQSLKASSFPHYEVLWFHDGPAPDTYWARLSQAIGPDSRFVLTNCNTRFNDYGHSLRDFGIDKSSGKYIVHLNADNVLYPFALETLYRASVGPDYAIEAKTLDNERKPFLFNRSVMIFAIKLMGQMNVFSREGIIRNQSFAGKLDLILPGWPPLQNKIDAMQLVATRDIWMRMGGWHDKSMNSDGILLPKIAEKYGYYLIPEVLGEHW